MLSAEVLSWLDFPDVPPEYFIAYIRGLYHLIPHSPSTDDLKVRYDPRFFIQKAFPTTPYLGRMWLQPRRTRVQVGGMPAVRNHFRIMAEPQGFTPREFYRVKQE
jgi:hypothetical protein